MTCMISFIITKAFVAPEINSTNQKQSTLYELCFRYIHHRVAQTNTSVRFKLNSPAYLLDQYRQRFKIEAYSSWQKTTTLRVSTTRPKGSNPFTNKQSWSFIYRNMLRFICISVVTLVHLIGILLVIAVRSPNNLRSLNFTSVTTVSQ